VRDNLLICHGLRLTLHVLRFPAYEQKVVLEPKLPHKSQYKHNVNWIIKERYSLVSWRTCGHWCIQQLVTIHDLRTKSCFGTNVPFILYGERKAGEIWQNRNRESWRKAGNL